VLRENINRFIAARRTFRTSLPSVCSDMYMPCMTKASTEPSPVAQSSTALPVAPGWDMAAAQHNQVIPLDMTRKRPTSETKRQSLRNIARNKKAWHLMKYDNYNHVRPAHRPGTVQSVADWLAAFPAACGLDSGDSRHSDKPNTPPTTAQRVE